MTTPTNTDDTIDSRDVIERIEELEQEYAYHVSEDEDDKLLSVWDDDLQEELDALQTFAKQFEDYADDYQYGAQAIRKSYFEQAMDEMVDDCYDLPEIPCFMTITLDYDMLMSDYSAIDFDGVTYYVR